MPDQIHHPSIRFVAQHLAMCLAGYELDCEANDEPVNQDAIVHSFMGNGASSELRVRDCYEFLYEIGYWNRNRNQENPS